MSLALARSGPGIKLANHRPDSFVGLRFLEGIASFLLLIPGILKSLQKCGGTTSPSATGLHLPLADRSGPVPGFGAAPASLTV
jgi:hypothetical protein